MDTPDAIRTHDLQSRSLTLYPAELQAHLYQLHSLLYQIPENFASPFCKFMRKINFSANNSVKGCKYEYI